MASNSKNNNNKQEKLDSNRNMKLSDCTCPICLYILIEPVTLPCGHEFCMNCFDTNVKETSLLCPMCRMRIASWARRASRNNNLINQTRWRAIQLAFPQKVQCRIQGIEGGSSSESEQDFIINPICEEGEIRKEYEDEVKRLEEERDRQRREEEEASARLIAAMQAEEFTRQLEQERQTLSDEAMARELSETTPLCLSSSASDPKLVKKTPTLMEKFVRKRPGCETNRNNNSVTGTLTSGDGMNSVQTKDAESYPYVCYSPKDYGKVITSEDVTMDHYPFVDMETLEKKRSRIQGDGNHGNREDEKQKKSKSEEETLLDFIFIDSREPTPLSPKQQDGDGIKSEQDTDTSALWATGAGKTKPTVNTKNTDDGKASKSTLKNWLTPEHKVIKSSKDTLFKGPVVSTPSSAVARQPVTRQSEEENSMGDDSIGPELVHFRPVKTYPKTSPERLPGGGLAKAPLVRSLPVSHKPKEMSPPSTAENLNPAKLGTSPVIQRHLLELQAERHIQVSLQSKATSTSVISLPCSPRGPQRKVDIFSRINSPKTPKEAVTMETAAFTTSSPRDKVKFLSKLNESSTSAVTMTTTTRQKSPVMIPDSTVVIGDSESGSSDVQLIDELPPPPANLLFEKSHKGEPLPPLLPILPLDNDFHGNQYPQLYYGNEDEEDNDDHCTIFSKITETVTRKSEKSETTSSSIIALMDTGQTEDSTTDEPEIVKSHLVSETTRSDAANLSLLCAYKEGDLTGSSSMFGLGTKGEETPMVAKGNVEPKLTSFSNVITPIKCRRDSREDLHLDNFTCAKIREESLDKLDASKSEQGSISHSGFDKGPITVIVPSDGSTPLSSNVQSSPRSKVYRMKRSSKTQSKMSSSHIAVNIDLTKSPTKTARSSEGQGTSPSKKGLNKAALLKMDLDVPVISPEVGVQQWLENQSYIVEKEGLPEEKLGQREVKGQQEEASINSTGKGIEVLLAESSVRSKSSNLERFEMENIGEKKTEFHHEKTQMKRKKTETCIEEKGEEKDCNENQGGLDVSFIDSVNSDAIVQDHSYSKGLSSSDKSPILGVDKGNSNLSSEGSGSVNSVGNQHDRISPSIFMKRVHDHSLDNQSLTRGNTGEFSVQGISNEVITTEKSEGHGTNNDSAKFIKSVTHNSVSVIGASAVDKMEDNSVNNMQYSFENSGQNSNRKRRATENAESSPEMFLNCSPTKKVKINHIEKVQGHEDIGVDEAFRTGSHGNLQCDDVDVSSGFVTAEVKDYATDDVKDKSKGSILASSSLDQTELSTNVLPSVSSQLCKQNMSRHLKNNSQEIFHCLCENDQEINGKACVCSVSDNRHIEATELSSKDSENPLQNTSQSSVKDQPNNILLSKKSKNLQKSSLDKSELVEKRKKVTKVKVSSSTPVKVKVASVDIEKKTPETSTISIDSQGDRKNVTEEMKESTGGRLVHKPPICGRGQKRRGEHASQTGSQGSEGIVGRKRGRPCKSVNKTPTKNLIEASSSQRNTSSEKAESESDAETRSISYRTRSKTPTKCQNVTPTKQLFKTATPCKDNDASTVRFKRTPSKSHDRKSCDWESREGIERTESTGSIAGRTRSTGVTPSKEMLEGVTPFKRISRGVTPCKDRKEGVTPSKRFGRGVTPCKGRKEGVTPGKRVVRGVTPNKDQKEGVTPGKRVVRGVTPNKDRNEVTSSKRPQRGVTPRKEGKTGVTPIKRVLRGVTPSKETKGSVTPRKREIRGVNSNKDTKTVYTPGKEKKNGVNSAEKIPKGVTPSKSIQKRFTPSKGKYDRGVTCNKRVHKGIKDSKDNDDAVENDDNDQAGENTHSISTRTRSTGLTPSKELLHGVTSSKDSNKKTTPSKAKGMQRAKTKMKAKTTTPSKVVSRDVTLNKMTSKSSIASESDLPERKLSNQVSQRSKRGHMSETKLEDFNLTDSVASGGVIVGSRGNKLSTKAKHQSNSGTKGEKIDKLKRESGEKAQGRNFIEGPDDVFCSEENIEIKNKVWHKSEKEQQRNRGNSSGKGSSIESSKSSGIIKTDLNKPCKKTKPQSNHSDSLFSSSEEELEEANVLGTETEGGPRKTVTPRGNTKRNPSSKGRKSVGKNTRGSKSRSGQGVKGVEYTPTLDGKKKIIVKKKQKVGGNVTVKEVKDTKKTKQTTLVFVGENSEDEFEENVKKVKKVLTFSKVNQEVGGQKEGNLSSKEKGRRFGMSKSEEFRPLTSSNLETDNTRNVEEIDLYKSNIKSNTISNIEISNKKRTRRPQSEVITTKSSSLHEYSNQPSCPWYGLDSPRKAIDSFRTDAEFQGYVEEQDRLMAIKLQADFDMEAKFHLTAIRRKGSTDEYKLRAKHRRKSSRN